MVWHVFSKMDLGRLQVYKGIFRAVSAADDDAKPVAT
jgi:hypothetical protein